MRALISAGAFLFVLAAIAGWDAVQQSRGPAGITQQTELSSLETNAPEPSSIGAHDAQLIRTQHTY